MSELLEDEGIKNFEGLVNFFKNKIKCMNA